MGFQGLQNSVTNTPSYTANDTQTHIRAILPNHVKCIYQVLVIFSRLYGTNHKIGVSCIPAPKYCFQFFPYLASISYVVNNRAKLKRFKPA